MKLKVNVVCTKVDVVVQLVIHAVKHHINAQNKRKFVEKIKCVVYRKLIFNVINKKLVLGLKIGMENKIKKK
jgi:hypothetical protein